jgi:spore germination protein KA
MYKMSTQGNVAKGKEQVKLTGNIELDEQQLRAVFLHCSDIIFHPFEIHNGTAALCVYCSGLCNVERLERQVLAPLQCQDEEIEQRYTQQDTTMTHHIEPYRAEATQQDLKQELPVSSVQVVSTVGEAVEAILDGETLVLIAGKAGGTVYPFVQDHSRTPEEPVAESTVRGARDGFTESQSMNLSLIRLRIKNSALKIKSQVMGKYTSTKVTLVYMEGIITDDLVKEVEARLDKIKLTDVLESQCIEEAISDQPYSPFPQMIATERPDVVVSNLLEGRFAIFVDGTPFCLVAPVTLSAMLQSPEDYYQNIYITIFIRWLRYFFYIIALLLPSFYVAITTYHQEMIPTVLMLSIARAREEIPFPALIEALIMEISFEALREAGIRLPKQIGSAVSIVGALIIGQAATSAGIVSAPMIIIVAMTGIASFMIPRYTASIATRIMRFPMMILAGTLGLPGIMLGIILLVIHLSSLRSFGTPYLSPIAPTSGPRLRDVWWRSSSWKKVK